MSRNYLLFFIIICFVSNTFLNNSLAQSNVLDVIENKCISCHSSRGSSPVKFKTVGDLLNYSEMIKYVITADLMPIWKPDKTYSHFENEMVLSENEKTIIIKWLNSNEKKFRQKKLKEIDKIHQEKAKKFVTIKTVKEITLNPIGEDLFGVVKIPFSFESEFYVSGLKFENELKNLLHHVSIFIVENDDENNTLINKPPYSYFLPPSNSAEKVNIYSYLGLNFGQEENYWKKLVYKTHWQPGRTVSTFPIGSGFKMPKKGYIVLDMIHYLYNPKIQFDNIKLTLTIGDNISRSMISTSIGIGSPFSSGEFILIKPDEQKWIESETVIPDKMSLFEITPHMHLIGTRFLSYAVTPELDTIPLIKIRDWDMAWQETYRFNKLIVLPAKTRIIIKGFYDNTKKNARNPNSPPKEIRQSMSKQDEMLLMMLTFFEYKNGDENTKLEYYE